MEVDHPGTGTFTSFDNNHDVKLVDEEDDQKRQFNLPGMSMRIGVDLPDLDNPDKVITRAFSAAPNWRIVYPGLNLEGECTTDSCPAFKKLVWCKFGLGKFDYGDDAPDVKCPSCGEFVDIQNVAYTSCWWNVKGTKRIQGKPQRVQGVWKYASGDGFTTYVYSKEELVHWDSLTIDTRSGDTKPSD